MRIRYLFHLAAALLCAVFISSTLAQGSAFTYQGQLTDGGSPANGSYDLKFRLYDEASGGGTVAGPITNSPVGVTNGLFTVTLDFGAGAFDGDERWLEIAVRTNGSAAGFTLLNPRQPLTATPYALQSLLTRADVLHGYLSGCLGASAVQYCIVGDGISCDQMMFVLVAIHEGHDVELYAGRSQTNYWNIKIRKTPRLGVPAAGAYDVTVNFADLPAGQEYEIQLAPDHPVANAQRDGGYTGVHRMEAQLVTDDLLLLHLDAEAIMTVTTESLGCIVSAQVLPYQASDRVAQLEVVLSNRGDLTTSYIVTVTGCGPTVAPVVAQSVALDPIPNINHTLTFQLRTSATFNATNQCLVQLRAPTGRLYDETVVTFPAPSGGDGE